jgi:hypothetical protein
MVLTTVRNIKRRPETGDVWLLTDAGYNLMLSMNNYKWYYHLISASRAVESTDAQYKVAGPLCDSGDVYFDIERHGRLPDYRLLPRDVKPGAWAGNLWIISVDGITPLSEMMTLDRAAVAKVAPTTMIQNAMMASARQYSANFGWQLIEYPKGQLVILNIPQQENQTIVQYVMNTLTGAWCQFIGLQACTWGIFNNKPYFGAADSRIYEWDTGSGDYVGDENLPVVATVQTAFNYFESRGHLKQWTMVRPIITTDGSIQPAVGLNIDFGSGAPLSIPAVNAAGGTDDGSPGRCRGSRPTCTTAIWTSAR